MIHAEDYSKWDVGGDAQGNLLMIPLDWSTYAKAGGVFTFIKVSDGLAIDPAFHLQWGAAAGHVYRSGYHYFRPTVDVVASVENFIYYQGTDRGELPPVLDLETTGGLDGSLVARRALQWLDLCYKKTGVLPIVYSGADFLQKIIRAQDFIEFGKYKLWLAQYYFDNMSDPARATKIHNVRMGYEPIAFPSTVSPFKTVTFFQWTGKGDPLDVAGYYTGGGSKKSVDFNLYNGSPDKLKTEFNLGNLEIPNMSTYRYDAKALGDGTRLRTDHNTAGTVKNTYPKSTLFSGDELFTATVPLSNSSGVYQSVGDQWLKVSTINGNPPFDTNGVPITTPVWVAITNKGVPFCSLIDNGVVTPPPPAGGLDVLVTIGIEGQKPLTLTGTTTPL